MGDGIVLRRANEKYFEMTIRGGFQERPGEVDAGSPARERPAEGFWVEDNLEQCEPEPAGGALPGVEPGGGPS